MRTNIITLARSVVAEAKLSNIDQKEAAAAAKRVPDP